MSILLEPHDTQANATRTMPIPGLSVIPDYTERAREAVVDLIAELHDSLPSEDRDGKAYLLECAGRIVKELRDIDEIVEQQEGGAS